MNIYNKNQTREISIKCSLFKFKSVIDKRIKIKKMKDYTEINIFNIL